MIIRSGDVEITGEIVQCLKILGLTDDDYPVQHGIAYLIGKEKSLKNKGCWVPHKRGNFHQSYHAVYCALIAILPIELDSSDRFDDLRWRHVFGD